VSIADRKERERLQRQNLIIDAAEKVFMSKGFEHATMDDVAEEAEFSKGTLYTYFQSKNELCLSIVLRGLKVLIGEFEKVVEESTLSINKIELLAAKFLKFYKKYPNFIFAFSNYKQHRAGCKFESTILQDIEIENRKIREIITMIIQNGKLDESIRSDADSGKLSYILWGEISGLIPTLLQEIDDVDTVALYNYTIQMMREALINRIK
jgi:AcrR family transcriptional regulator